MPENADTSAEAFQHLVRLLEKAVQAKADALGLEREGQDLMVIHYFGSVGRVGTPIPQDLEQAVIREIVLRAGLVDQSRGSMKVSLLGKDYNVVVDERDDWGESEFTLTLKKGGKKEGKLSWQGGNIVPETQPMPTFSGGNCGRNDPCPCGSGKKFKKCCLNKQNGSSLVD